MKNANQSVRTCILKVDVKCCTGCQKKARKKLETISGVTKTEYNQEKGLMTVTGDVEPMALVNKLTKCNRKTELVSVKYQLDDDDLISDDEDETSSDSHSHSSREKIKQQKKTGILEKFSLFGCFRRKTDIYLPLALKQAQKAAKQNVRSKSENGRNDKPWQQQHQQPAYQNTPYGYILVQQPQHGGQMMPNNVNMSQPAPQQTHPYFQSSQERTGNPELHYRN